MLTRQSRILNTLVRQFSSLNQTANSIHLKDTSSNSLYPFTTISLIPDSFSVLEKLNSKTNISKQNLSVEESKGVLPLPVLLWGPAMNLDAKVLKRKEGFEGFFNSVNTFVSQTEGRLEAKASDNSMGVLDTFTGNLYVSGNQFVNMVILIIMRRSYKFFAYFHLYFKSQNFLFKTGKKFTQILLYFRIFNSLINVIRIRSH